MTKPFLAARAAEVGVQSALMARARFEGPADVFEESRGFFAALNSGTAEWTAASSLGREFSIVCPGLLFKIYPVCSAAQAAAEATQEILAELNVLGDEITKVVCEAPRLVAISLTHSRPSTVQEAQFSLEFAVGAMLVFGRLDPSILNAECLGNERLRSAYSKVEMHESNEGNFDDCPEGIRLNVETRTGKQITRFKCVATGDPRKPLSNEALEVKFRDCVCNVSVAEALFKRIQALPDQEHAAYEIMDQLLYGNL
jgi:2-methylcitrate dehydratase PrpD